MDAGASLAVEMIQAKTDQLGHAQTCGKGQMQHRPVPNAELRARVWRIEQGLHLFARQIADQRLVGLLHRNRMDAPRLVEARRQPILQEAEERVDGRQPGIAGPGRVVTFALDVLEEGQISGASICSISSGNGLTLSWRAAKQTRSWKL